MGKDTVTTADTAPGALFMAFAFAVAGWALLERWLIQIDAGVRAHFMATLFGLSLGYLSIRRPRIDRAGLPSGGVMTASGHHAFGRAELGWSLLLLVFGLILGTLVLRGDTMLLGLATMSLAMAPWSRVHFCRSYLLAACTTVWTGMAFVILPGPSAIAPMFLPIASWILWVSAMSALVLGSSSCRGLSVLPKHGLEIPFGSFRRQSGVIAEPRQAVVTRR